jgi:hypothetical protein
MNRWTRKQVTPHPLGHTILDQSWEGLGGLPAQLREEWEAIPGGQITCVDISYEYAKAQVDANRRAAYPAIGDQLDAIYKARQGDTTMQAEIDQAITNVKAQYPNPPQPAQTGGAYGFLSKQVAKSPVVEAARKPLQTWQTVLLNLLVSSAVFAAGTYLLEVLRRG